MSSPGEFEGHIGALGEVRAFVVLTFDPDAQPEHLTGLVAVCGTAGCVRPPHLDRPAAR